VNQDIIYQIALITVPGIGTVNARKLVAHCGSPEAVFKEKKKNLLKINGIGDSIIASLGSSEILQKAEQEAQFAEKHNINVLYCLNDNYPERLRNCPDAPFLLFSKGAANLNQRKIISIVGTRRSTDYGREICNSLISGLKARGHEVLIVSGLAYGIDIHAHKAALKNGLPTLAALAHGFKTIYPSPHKSIAREMIDSGGALLTEFTSETIPDKANFVKRNRIVAGIADATLVVESPIKSGALITADLANSYNRDVFAFPGRTNDVFSQGCNALIKSNKANMIENVEDLEYFLGWDSPGKEKVIQTQMFTELNDTEKQIVGLIRENNEMYIDQICGATGLPISTLSNCLINLEFAGIIRCLPGKCYRMV
jgi:DNA processing protein